MERNTKKNNSKRNGKTGEQLLREWHNKMSENFFGLAENCANRGYPENYNYWMGKYRYHMKLS